MMCCPLTLRPFAVCMISTGKSICSASMSGFAQSRPHLHGGFSWSASMPLAQVGCLRRADLLTSHRRWLTDSSPSFGLGRSYRLLHHLRHLAGLGWVEGRVMALQRPAVITPRPPHPTPAALFARGKPMPRLEALGAKVLVAHVSIAFVA